MVFATDAGVMPHGTAGGQFRVMTEYGMTPMEAIQAATRNAAQALGREADVGAIAVGRYEDIIAVDGDPLANVRELEDVDVRSEEHTSELQSLMRISYAVFCLKKKKTRTTVNIVTHH